jgi:hypothetical protein
MAILALSTKVDRVEQYNLGNLQQPLMALGCFFGPCFCAFWPFLQKAFTLNDGLGQSSAAVNGFLAFSTKDDQFKL